MIDYFWTNPSVISAFLSLLATCFAAWATWQGPRSAAKLSEEIRINSERANERRRMKLNLFATLMQERANIVSIDSVRMLNSIDFIFYDSVKVREAWAELFNVFQTNGIPHPQLQEDKLRNLLREMAADIGFSDSLKVNDLGRIYYPNALAKEEELRLLRQEQALLQIRAQNSSAATDPAPLDKFPPKPL